MAEVKTHTRLKCYKYPSHAELRARVFGRDKFRCCMCNARALEVPQNYSGKKTLFCELPPEYKGKVKTNILVLDHIVPIRLGGLTIESNLQTLCDICNAKKVKADRLVG